MEGKRGFIFLIIQSIKIMLFIKSWPDFVWKRAHYYTDCRVQKGVFFAVIIRRKYNMQIEQFLSGEIKRFLKRFWAQSMRSYSFSLFDPKRWNGRSIRKQFPFNVFLLLRIKQNTGKDAITKWMRGLHLWKQKQALIGHERMNE